MIHKYHSEVDTIYRRYGRSAHVLNKHTDPGHSKIRHYLRNSTDGKCVYGYNGSLDPIRVPEFTWGEHDLFIVVVGLKHIKGVFYIYDYKKIRYNGLLVFVKYIKIDTIELNKRKRKDNKTNIIFKELYDKMLEGYRFYADPRGWGKILNKKLDYFE